MRPPVGRKNKKSQKQKKKKTKNKKKTTTITTNKQNNRNNCLNCDYNCDGHIVTSLWLFIAQLVEHCCTNAEAKGLNSVGPKNLFFSGLERFSNECRKTKTKVITPANHNKNKLPNEPIRTRSKYM